MHIGRIINRKSDYYIASYSVHASILETLTGKNPRKIKLLVDGGGLTAHAGTFENAEIFKDYTPITHKTLHAKVIYLSTPKLLCLMTGNLRKTAVTEEENIVIIQSLNSRQGAEVIRWFKKEKLSYHLFIQINDSSVKNVYTNSSSIWEEFSARIKEIEGSSLSVYAFSPWGSSKFVREIGNEIGKLMKDRMSKLALYTRKANSDQEKEKTSMWIDYNLKGKLIQTERYTRKEGLDLPHFKAIFITERNSNSKEKLVLTYIGSANLTDAAFFKKKNIEYAAFFTDIKRTSPVNLIFNELKRKKNWEKRSVSKKVTREVDDEREGLEVWENTDSFEIRRLEKKLIARFKSSKMQRKLEDSYRQSKKLQFQVKDLNFTIDVKSIISGMFELDVRTSKHTFPLSIVRNSSEEILSNDDIHASLEQLMNISMPEKPERQQKQMKSRGENQKPSNLWKFKNIRFPLEKFIRNKSLIETKKHDVKKLKKSAGRLDQDGKEIYEMWSQIIGHL